MDDHVKLECAEARPLVPLFVDGELSPALSPPLRQHLMACPACRAVAAEEKALKRWFARDPEPVPAGFAERVARRAFAGDTGSRDAAPALLPGAPADVPVGVGAGAWSAAAVAGPREDRLLQFVLQATAVAAVLLITLSIAIRTASLPSGSGLRADDAQERSLDEVLEDLKRLNRTADGDAAAEPAAAEGADAAADADRDAPAPEGAERR
jgi:hypothetical protein